VLDEEQQDKLLHKFFEHIPSAEALLVFSRQRAQKGAKMPLFIVAQNCGFEKFRDFIKHYFPAVTPENSKMVFDLLELKDENNRRLDYHYFEKNLPQETVDETRQAFGMPELRSYLDYGQYRKYVFLRNYKMAAVRKYGVAHPNALDFEMMRQTPSDTLPLALRFYPTDENPVTIPFMAAGPIVPSKPWKKQAFANMDYPETANWSAPAIAKIEKEFHEVEKDSYFRSVAQSFLDLSEVVLCNTYRDEDGKDGQGMDFAGEAGKINVVDNSGIASSWLAYYHYADSKQKGNVLAHEATHIADMYADDRIAENNFTHQACKLAYLNYGESEFRSKIVRNIVESYNPEDFESEMTAYATEVYMERRNKKDVLLRAASKMLATYVDAEGEDNINILEYMKYAQKNIPHQEELDRLEDIYKNMLNKKCLAIRKHKTHTLGETPKNKAKIAKICQKKGGLKKIERDVTAYMLQTLRVVNFISRNPKLKNYSKLKPRDFEHLFMQKIGREKAVEQSVKLAAKRASRE